MVCCFLGKAPLESMTESTPDKHVMVFFSASRSHWRHMGVIDSSKDLNKIHLWNGESSSDFNILFFFFFVNSSNLNGVQFAMLCKTRSRLYSDMSSVFGWHMYVTPSAMKRMTWRVFLRLLVRCLFYVELHCVNRSGLHSVCMVLSVPPTHARCSFLHPKQSCNR